MYELGGEKLVPTTWIFFNELLIILSVGKVMMSFSGHFYLSEIMISIVMKYISFWYIYLDYVSTFILFPLSVVIFNQLL